MVKSLFKVKFPSIRPHKFVNRINDIKQILENKEKAVVPIAENPLKRRKPHCKLRKNPQNERYDIVLG
jgi:hypothetical protein